MEHRVAVITGAGSGIGRAVALALSQKAYRLVLVGRRLSALEETAELVRANGSAVETVSADVTVAEDVQRAFDAAVARFSRVDLLFNNAGMNGPPVPFDAIGLEDWRRVIDVNLTGAFRCAQAAFRVMKAQQPRGGRIINNGSISAHAPRPDSAPYTASKHAITGLTKALSLDGRAFDIACAQIDIGNAATAMGSRMSGGVRQANGAIAAEPLMDVTRVGDAVAFMDSLPLDENVQFMTIMATKMPFVGRG